MYKPDLSVKYAPRVPRRLRKAVERICRRHEMPEADVLRYSFEAAVLTSSGNLTQNRSSWSDALDSMMTVRTSAKINRIVTDLWRNTPNALKADILRSLFDSIIPIAEKHGMAHVMRIREEALGWKNSPRG